MLNDEIDSHIERYESWLNVSCVIENIYLSQQYTIARYICTPKMWYAQIGNTRSQKYIESVDVWYSFGQCQMSFSRAWTVWK